MAMTSKNWFKIVQDHPGLANEIVDVLSGSYHNSRTEPEPEKGKRQGYSLVSYSDTE
jgi:hypothetical protein